MKQIIEPHLKETKSIAYERHIKTILLTLLSVIY